MNYKDKVNKLFETGDELSSKLLGFDVEWNDEGNYAFVYSMKDDIIYISEEGENHSQIYSNNPNLKLSKNQLTDISGRVWSDVNVISFWEFPKDFGELKKIVVRIEKKLDLEILNKSDWRVEVYFDDDSILIPIKDYTTENITQDNLDELKKKKDIHVMDSEQKKKIMLRNGYRGKETKWKKYMKPFESKIYEGGDTLNHPDHNIDAIYRNGNNIAFMYDDLKKNIYVSELGETHSSIFDAIDHDELDIDYIDYNGRVWEDYKIISFWEYPKDYEKLTEIVKKLEEKLNMNIFNHGWKIEVFSPDSHMWKQQYILIPIEEYSSQQPTDEQFTELNKQRELHLMDSEEKKKSLMNQGYRSKHSKWKKHMKPFEKFNIDNQDFI